MFVTPAFAQTAGAAGSDPTALIVQFAPFLLIFVVMYFLIIRPQQQKQKAHTEMLKALGRNDVIVTTGGLIGKIVKVIDDQEFLVEIAENVRVRISRAHVQERVVRGEPIKEATSV